MPNEISLEVLSDSIKARMKMPSSTQEMRRRLDIVCEKALLAGICNIEVEIDMGPSHKDRCYRFQVTADTTSSTRKRKISRQKSH